jgi:hypothetical protein
MIDDHYSVDRGVPEVVDLTSEIMEQSSAKRKADAKLTAVDEAKKPKHGSSAASNILVETYWDSPEAKKLFLGDSKYKCDVEVLKQWIE